MKKILWGIGVPTFLIGAFLFVTHGDFLKANILERDSKIPGVQQQVTKAGVHNPEKNPIQKPGNTAEIQKPENGEEAKKLADITPISGTEAPPVKAPAAAKPAQVPPGQERGFLAKGIVESEEEIDIGSQVSASSPGFRPERETG